MTNRLFYVRIVFNMKKALISSFIFAMALLASSTAEAQSKPLLFQFLSPEKPEVVPAVQQPTTTRDVTEDIFDFTELKNQPLTIRRKIVASQLNDISLRLDVLYGKTKIATDRLTQNKIDTTGSNIALATAMTHLTEAKTTIDSLLLAANDPKNENVATLMLKNVTFKDSVIAAETSLRNARTSIIASLVALRTAVSTSLTTTEN